MNTCSLRNVRHYFVAIALAAMALPPAYGRDSLWLVGDDGSIAVTTFERRNSTGDGRETNVTLIYGEYVLRGMLRGADSGKIELTEMGHPSDPYVFTGNISVSYGEPQANRVRLSGVLKYGSHGDRKIDTTISCKEMKND